MEALDGFVVGDGDSLFLWLGWWYRSGGDPKSNIESTWLVEIQMVTFRFRGLWRSRW